MTKHDVADGFKAVELKMRGRRVGIMFGDD